MATIDTNNHPSGQQQPALILKRLEVLSSGFINIFRETT